MAHLPRVSAGPAKAAPGAPVAGSSWIALTNAPGVSGLSNPLLMTDGTVIVHAYCSPNWYKLTPNNGSYLNGTWSQIGALPSGYGPLYFASQILSNGSVVMNGGEYDISSNCTEVWTTNGAIYNPTNNVWTTVAPPSGWGNIGDAQSVILFNGRYMLANCCSTQEALFTPSTGAWTSTGTNKFDWNDEEGWTLLHDGTILTTDAYVRSGTCGLNTERYRPSTGAWTSAGTTTTQISDCASSGGHSATYEVGPLLLRPNGTVVSFSALATGAVAGTSIFNSATATWGTGPNLPVIGGVPYDLADAPAVTLPDGNILFAASPGFGQAPTHFFEYTTSNQIKQVGDTGNSAGEADYQVNFLLLPTGQVLQTDFSGTVWLYTTQGQANANWAPVLNYLDDTNLSRGSLHSFAGTQMNGITHGTYGDDQQAATNFPLIRITNDATGHVYYAKTLNFSNRSIAPNSQSTAQFRMPLPGRIETGPSELAIVANGIASSLTAVNVQ